MVLYPAEKIVGGIIAVLLMINIALASAKGVTVDWLGYAVGGSMGLAAIAIGQFYRLYRHDEKIAVPTTATGFYLLFSLVGSVFNYLLLPVGESYDRVLIEWDRALGFYWPDFVQAVVEVPYLPTILRVIYGSSLIQITCVILLVGFFGSKRSLHLFLLTGTLSALLTILVWRIIPSAGPAAYYPLPSEVANRLGAIADHAYGLELLRLYREGAAYISPKDTLGLIAFPSFHTVMACLSVYFTMDFRKIFPVIAVINILMVPAIIVHGGHNIVDLFGGVAAFILALLAARAVLGLGQSEVKAQLATESH
ncbi:phosphatase PAP2 family protein [Phyllobacterium sp. UNC302MFCol5.2]|uniref:phosphatase PAP2 family protein n=1 Tax=Phyllobacterium sp. UNC302MFCol5.2 TaxID=1449065 RepID=UPI00068AED74|nr:phosphatase PAP2 family protein [Phyllobacterium sp. UNC302MFCol5.2]